MKLKQLIQEDDGVSPVIGVILMVAITVILAAVIGTFVLGLGQNVQTSAPQASFNFDEAGNNDVTVVHDGGDKIEESQLTVDCGPSGTPGSWPTGDSQVTAGDSLTCTSMNSDETVQVIWNSDDGSNSQVLAEYTTS